MLSQHIDTTHAMDLMSRAGFGYLLKDRVLDVQDFLAAAQRVADGGSALDPQVVGALMAPRPATTRSRRCRTGSGMSWS